MTSEENLFVYNKVLVGLLIVVFILLMVTVFWVNGFQEYKLALAFVFVSVGFLCTAMEFIRIGRSNADNKAQAKLSLIIFNFYYLIWVYYLKSREPR